MTLEPGATAIETVTVRIPKLASAGQLTLSHGPGGLRSGPVQVMLGQPLAPHSSRQVKVRFAKQLPRGPWDVQIRLTSGSVVRSSSATLTFPGLAH